MVRFWKTMQATFKGFRLEGWSVRSHWEFLDSGVIWQNRLFHRSCMHGRLEPRDSGSYCSCPGMKRKGRFDGIHGNRKGKIGKLFWRQEQQDLITDWTWVYERRIGNNKWLRGFELGSYENKSEMEMLIERAALRRKTESLGERVEFHIMTEYVSGNALHSLESKTRVTFFLFFSLLSCLLLLPLSSSSFFCSLSMILSASEALSEDFWEYI